MSSFIQPQFNQDVETMERLEGRASNMVRSYEFMLYKGGLRDLGLFVCLSICLVCFFGKEGNLII